MQCTHSTNDVSCHLMADHEHACRQLMVILSSWSCCALPFCAILACVLLVAHHHFEKSQRSMLQGLLKLLALAMKVILSSSSHGAALLHVCPFMYTTKHHARGVGSTTGWWTLRAIFVNAPLQGCNAPCSLVVVPNICPNKHPLWESRALSTCRLWLCFFSRLWMLLGRTVSK